MAELPNDVPELPHAFEDGEKKRAAVIENAKAKIAHKAVAFRRLFVEHPDGAYVLRCIKQEFLPSVLTSDNLAKTQAHAAYRDVVDYIERMSRFQEAQPHVDEEVLLPER